MDKIVQLSYIGLIIAGIALIGVVIAYFVVKNKEEKEEETPISGGQANKKPQIDTKTKIAKEYTNKSIFDFMEFENVKDNMIVQKDGKRFLMAVECQGVNYDLMSEVEQAATEQGFSMFLNSLREPIQIYIQTRKVNLEKNILNYKQRVDKIRDEYNLKERRLKQYMEQDYVNEKVLNDKKFEVIRQSNIYNYGKDIIKDTERMSLNKNVLKKKYYIIIRYFYEPTDSEEPELLSKEEISEIAFSNLYTRATSMIRVLAGIGIVGRALNSFELVDLLYNAYNRDDSEIFGIEKAIEAGYNEMYVDAQSATDKKIAALNKEIQLRAQQSIKDALDEVQDENEKELKYIEDNIEDIILELAQKMVEDEDTNIPLDTKEKVVKKLAKKGEKGTNGKKETKESTRKRRAG